MWASTHGLLGNDSRKNHLEKAAKVRIWLSRFLQQFPDKFEEIFMIYYVKFGLQTWYKQHWRKCLYILCFWVISSPLMCHFCLPCFPTPQDSTVDSSLHIFLPSDLLVLSFPSPFSPSSWHGGSQTNEHTLVINQTRKKLMCRETFNLAVLKKVISTQAFY